MARTTNQTHKTSWGAAHQHGVARKQDLGNTHTPPDLAGALVRSFLMDDLRRQIATPGWWLEPAVGSGGFYVAALEEGERLGIDPLAFARVFDAVDVDPDSIAALKNRLMHRFGWSWAVVDALPIHTTSLAAFRPGHAYQTIVTNPPYLAPRDWADTAAERDALLAQWQAVVPGLDARADLFMYFFCWCHRHLAPDGVGLFLCSDGWLDSDYGSSLRRAFVDGARAPLTPIPAAIEPVVVLQSLTAWPWKSLFRDDTSPIVTRVRRIDGSARTDGRTTQVVVDDGDPLADASGRAAERTVYRNGRRRLHTRDLDAEALAAWLGEEATNRRQMLVSGPELYGRGQDILQRVRSACAPLRDWTDVSSFSWSLNDLLKADLLLAQPGATGQKARADAAAPDAGAWANATPVFFQKQGRVNAPANYKQIRTTADLLCRIALGATGPAATNLASTDLARRVRSTGLKTGGAWVALAIDRMPLAFFPGPIDREHTWVGLSKYAHVSARQGIVPKQADAGAVLAAVVTSSIGVLAMELGLKEGTRKTLRVNENGYAKEITRSALADLPLPDPRRWSAATWTAVAAAQARRGTKDLKRWDAAVVDPDWLEADEAIGAACGLTTAERAHVRTVVTALYWRRMRNTLEYGAAERAVDGP